MGGCTTNRGAAEAGSVRRRLRVAALPGGVARPLCLTLLVATAAAGCGVLSPEEQLLNDFFEAARLHDTTAVAKFSVVTFNPRVDGIVDSFEVQEVVNAGDTRRVTVRASVRRLEGPVAEKTMVFTLARRGERWFITGIGGP
jgi:hypothetical protein